MKILAIETSCDETAAAVLDINRGNFNLLSNIVSSQVKIHAKYGGIVPEVAARKQMEMIMPIIEQALLKSGLKSKNIKFGGSNKAAPSRTWSQHLRTWSQQIDYIAVTYGPGLITSLTVGVETAKTLSLVLNKPLIPVNHLAGHIYSNFLLSPGRRHVNVSPAKVKFPALSLIVSGGHTMLVLIKKHGDYKIIGQTLDDAAGEAFDKVAKILNLGYPGGPVISKLATSGNPNAFDLPRPMINQNNFDFSFSGLKTATSYLVKDLKKDKKTKCKLLNVKCQLLNDVCASFQQAVVDVLVTKSLKAIKKYQPRSFLLGGGVAANSELRKQLQEKISAQFPKVKIFIPELKFTGDNAAMIAAAAYFERNKKQLTSNKVYNLKADPNLLL